MRSSWYPGDALLCELPSSFTTDEEEGHGDSFDFDDDENEAIDDVVLWGSHVPQSDRWDDDTVFDGSNYNPPLMSYAQLRYIRSWDIHHLTMTLHTWALCKR